MAGGLNPKPGQAAAGREDVVDELELGVGLLSCNTWLHSQQLGFESQYPAN